MIDTVTPAALATSNWLAGEPTTWDQGSTMSTLDALLLFVGGPIVVMALITLMTLAPSLAKGPRYRPGIDDAADPEWFGTLPEAAHSGVPQIEGAHRSPDRQQATAATSDRLTDDDPGGASARW